MPNAALRKMDRELLAAAIAATGLTERQFALRVMRSNPSTVGRWLAGERAILGPAAQLCRAILAHPRLWRELAGDDA